MAANVSINSRLLLEVRMFVDANDSHSLIRTYWVKIPEDAADQLDEAEGLATKAVNTSLPADLQNLGPFYFEILPSPSSTPGILCSSIFPAFTNNRCKVWLVEDQFKKH